MPNIEIRKRYVMLFSNVAGRGVRPMVNALGSSIHLARENESLPELAEDEELVVVFVARDQDHFRGMRMRVFTSLSVVRRRGFDVPEELVQSVGERKATWVALRPSACGTPDLAEVFRNFHYLENGVWKGPPGLSRHAVRKALQKERSRENRLERIRSGGCC